MNTALNNLNVTDELTKAVNQALDPADIKAAILAEAQNQQNTLEANTAALAAAEKVAADKLAADQAAASAAPTEFTRTEVIGGREFTFEAANELELERMVTNAYKVAYAVQPTETIHEPVVENTITAEEAQKIAEKELADKVELDLQFKRGDITASDYIERSGAVKAYLQKEGLSVDAIKAAVNRTQADTEQQSWSSAVEVFLNTPAGSDWPGGEQNVKLIGMQVAALGLTDATDKVAALAQAYQSLKANGILFSNAAVEKNAAEKTPVADTAAIEAAAKATAEKAAADANARATAEANARAAAVQTRTPASSSSLFGASSGTYGTPAAASVSNDQAAATKLAADASPAEILDAWKKAQIAAGRNPDDAFKETYSARRM